MADPELRYTTALALLRVAERAYADAEAALIAARREVMAAEVDTKYHKILNAR